MKHLNRPSASFVSSNGVELNISAACRPIYSSNRPGAKIVGADESWAKFSICLEFPLDNELVGGFIEEDGSAEAEAKKEVAAVFAALKMSPADAAKAIELVDKVGAEAIKNPIFSL